jgi:sec-independent protein translocase protein TatB
MFDMGFTEMMLIGIVALIVIGPERLPGVARTAGKYFGRLKRFVSSVKADVEQELRTDELRQILADQKKELDTIKDSMNDASKAFEKEVTAVTEAGDLTDSLEETPSSTDQVPAASDVDPEPATESEPLAKDPAGEVKS